MKNKNRVYLSIGTNLGDRCSNLKRAINLIKSEIGAINRCSSIYITQAWGFESKNNFLNIVVELATILEAESVLNKTQRIEQILGRERLHKQYSSRIIDIDILLFNDIIVSKSNLHIPHPRFHLRNFVLFPLAEINSDLIHPIILKKVSTLLNECEDTSAIRKFKAIEI